MDDVLSLKESVLYYLDRSGGLLKLAEDCKTFNGKWWNFPSESGRK